MQRTGGGGADAALGTPLTNTSSGDGSRQRLLYELGARVAHHSRILDCLYLQTWFTTFRQIRGARDVGGRTVFPYATTWMNAVALVVYAWPKGDWEVVVVNMIAFVAESLYCFWYIKHSAGWNRVIACVMAFIQLAFAVGLIVCQITLFTHDQHHQERELAFGWIGAITAMLMYISPTKETYVAWRNHNAQGLSMGLSLAFLSNAAIWFGYSFIHPFNLYYCVANATGIGSAVVQSLVWLYCRYHGQ